MTTTNLTGRPRTAAAADHAQRVGERHASQFTRMELADWYAPEALMLQVSDIDVLLEPETVNRVQIVIRGYDEDEGDWERCASGGCTDDCIGFYSCPRCDALYADNGACLDCGECLTCCACGDDRIACTGPGRRPDGSTCYACERPPADATPHVAPPEWA